MSYYLAIDVEASGGSHTRNFVPCLGAALVDVKGLKVMDTFFAFLEQPENTEWDDRSLREFWLKKDNIGWYGDILRALKDPAKARPVRETMLEFVMWARAWVAKLGFENVVVISDTAGFDAGWFDHLLPAPHTMLYLLGDYKPVRDVSSWYMGIARCTPETSLWGSFKRAHIALGLGEVLPTFEYVHDHRPDNDAAHIGLCAAYIANAVDRPSLC
jgi:hypothetical protein